MPYVERPPVMPSIRRQGQIASQLQDSRYEPATRQPTAMREIIRRRTISVNVILENGVIHTLDLSLPVARSLAITGDRVAGGVGTHETALPGPERIDLGGRCVVPGFTDSHVHFPTWAVAQDEVRLEDTRSLDEALARIREALPASKGT